MLWIFPSLLGCFANPPNPPELIAQLGVAAMPWVRDDSLVSAGLALITTTDSLFSTLRSLSEEDVTRTFGFQVALKRFMEGLRLLNKIQFSDDLRYLKRDVLITRAATKIIWHLEKATGRPLSDEAIALILEAGQIAKELKLPEEDMDNVPQHMEWTMESLILLGAAAVTQISKSSVTKTTYWGTVTDTPLVSSGNSNGLLARCDWVQAFAVHTDLKHLNLLGQSSPFRSRTHQQTLESLTDEEADVILKFDKTKNKEFNGWIAESDNII